MSSKFDLFVLFAEMRTGSNLLESNLNAFRGLTCHGEVFNPHFVGFPRKESLLGVSYSEREKDPHRLISAMRNDPDGLAGFRYFHDHDKRVLEPCLSDRRCAKIILTRNPLDSYISWKIAQQTGQWKVTNVAHKREAKVRFEAEEFATWLNRQRRFRAHVLKALQTSGQTAFQLDYNDLQDIAVINGLAQFLGQDDRLEKTVQTLKKQNNRTIQEKVLNFRQMEQALASMDHFNLEGATDMEPARGAAVPSYIASPNGGFLWLPIAGPAVKPVVTWLTDLNPGGEADLLRGFDQKTLRQWKRKNRSHRSFSVVCHPAARAHWAFCHHILNPGPGCFAEIRDTLRQKMDHPLPVRKPGANWTKADHRAAFLAFLGFVKDNLAGQTSIRIDPAWASQSELLRGIAGFQTPDMVLRAENLIDGMSQLTMDYDDDVPTIGALDRDRPYRLSDIYDGEIESAVRSAYQRDYMIFGYGAYAA